MEFNCECSNPDDGAGSRIALSLEESGKGEGKGETGEALLALGCVDFQEYFIANLLCRGSSSE